jgi:hypothetical protein
LTSSYSLLAFRHDALLAAAASAAVGKAALAAGAAVRANGGISAQQQEQKQQQQQEQLTDTLLLLLSDILSVNAVTAGQNMEGIAREVLLPHAREKWTQRLTPVPLLKLAVAAAAFKWPKEGWVEMLSDPQLQSVWQAGREATGKAAASRSRNWTGPLLPPGGTGDSESIDTPTSNSSSESTSSSSSGRADLLGIRDFLRKFSKKQLWRAALATSALRDQWDLVPGTQLLLLPPWSPLADQLLFDTLQVLEGCKGALGVTSAAVHAEHAGTASRADGGGSPAGGTGMEGSGVGTRDMAQQKLVEQLLQLVPAGHKVVPLAGGGTQHTAPRAGGRSLSRSSCLHGAVLVMRPEAGPVLFLLPQPLVVDVGTMRGGLLGRSPTGGGDGSSSSISSNRSSRSTETYEELGELALRALDVDSRGDGTDSSIDNVTLGSEQQLELELLRCFCEKAGVQLVHLRAHGG